MLYDINDKIGNLLKFHTYVVLSTLFCSKQIIPILCKIFSPGEGACAVELSESGARGLDYTSAKVAASELARSGDPGPSR